MVITAIIALLAAITAYWMNGTPQDHKKDDALSAAASAPSTIVNNAAPSTSPTNISQ